MCVCMRKTKWRDIFEFFKPVKELTPVLEQELELEHVFAQVNY